MKSDLSVPADVNSVHIQTHILGVGVGSWVEEKGKSDFEMYLLNHC